MVIYVDELILTRSSIYMIQSFQLALMEYFDMTNLGLLYFFLGL